MEGFTQPSLAMSTFRPNRLSSSSLRAAWSRRLAPSYHVTSKSMSLSGRASPRATDPINRTWVAPCAAATRRIVSRCSRIVSPMATPVTKNSTLIGVYRRTAMALLLRACDTKVERREKLQRKPQDPCVPVLQAARRATPGEESRASRPQAVSGAAVLYTSSDQENFRLARF